MVKRKPVNVGVNRASSGLPYPVAPISPKEVISEAPSFPPGAERSQNPNARLPSDVSTSDMANSTRAWANDDTYRGGTSSELPSTLRVGEGRQPIDGAHGEGVLPPSLQFGPMDDTPRSSFESATPMRPLANKEQVSKSNQNILGSTAQYHNPNNPYLRQRDTDSVPPQGSSADVWADIARSSSPRPHEAKYSSGSNQKQQQTAGI